VRLILLLCLGLVSLFSLNGCEKTEEMSTIPGSEAGFDRIGTFFKPVQADSTGPTKLVYVPVYSRLFLSKDSFWEMGTTLSIRNTDPDQSLYVYEIDYFDTAGDLIERFLDQPHELQPMATVTLTLPQWDKRGGSGANFLVRWSGDADINNPIIEVVMAGTRGQQSFSFIRPGQEIVE